MHITALYGPSGTGKSSSALAFAHTRDIEAIIDDGLLIIDGKNVAGLSAKFEKNTLTAVKRAIFMDEAHCQSVKDAIKENNIATIMVIGTSMRMVNRIVYRLELGEVDEYVEIEEVRTQEEILLAKYVRAINGKHTMPIPYNQVEQNFFRRMVQKGRDIFSSKSEKIGETTLVTPDFHRQTIYVAGRVYEQVLHNVAQEYKQVKTVHRSTFRFTEHLPVVLLEVSIAAPVTYDVVTSMQQLQQEVQRAFETMFELKLSTVHVVVRSIQT